MKAVADCHMKPVAEQSQTNLAAVVASFVEASEEPKESAEEMDCTGRRTALSTFHYCYILLHSKDK